MAKQLDTFLPRYLIRAGQRPNAGPTQLARDMSKSNDLRGDFHRYRWISKYFLVGKTIRLGLGRALSRGNCMARSPVLSLLQFTHPSLAQAHA